MKIVVTGALGHIGSSLIRSLPYSFPNSEIILIDNMMTQRYSSLFNLPNIGNYKFIEADITNCDLLQILKGSDFVIHLAAITDAAGSFDKATIVEENNFSGTVKIADACLLLNIKMISLSSTSVYGTQNEVVSEDCTIDELKPQSPYAITKLKEEDYLQNLAKQKGLKVVVCRFGTIYGSSVGMRFHTAVNKFCWQAVMKQPISVWKTAYNQKRPYLELNDALNAFIFLIRQNIFDGQVYNVLTQNSTVSQIVDCIKEFVPSLEISFVENKIMNQLSYEVSSEKFKKLGFIFTGDLRQSIGNTISLLKNSNTSY
jgi:nucleoside-diphosphate-sugar epimerase